MWKILFASLACVAASVGPSESLGSEPEIDVWYGARQRFGHRRTPQRYVNVLGRANGENNLKLSYRLNGIAEQPLSLGPNYTRLAEQGDFNVEIDVSRLNPGENTVALTATDEQGGSTRQTVVVDWAPDGKAELPFEIVWSRAERIDDVAQIIDGRWELVEGGIRCLEPYYDRVIGFGDMSWTDYEVSTTVTFHGRRLPGEKDGGRNVIHAAIATRWPGHDPDEHQPFVKWYPLGATSEFMLTDWPDGCRWRILGGRTRDRHTYEDRRRTIEFDRLYGMKHRVQTQPDGGTQYAVKLWHAEQDEPQEWDFTGTESPDDITQGGALLLAHYTEVTFGNVTVTEVP